MSRTRPDLYAFVAAWEAARKAAGVTVAQREPHGACPECGGKLAILRARDWEWECGHCFRLWLDEGGV